MTPVASTVALEAIAAIASTPAFSAVSATTPTIATWLISAFTLRGRSGVRSVGPTPTSTASISVGGLRVVAAAVAALGHLSAFGSFLCAVVAIAIGARIVALRRCRWRASVGGSAFAVRVFVLSVHSGAMRPTAAARPASAWALAHEVGLKKELLTAYETHQ
jgi:hypothetical protein